jgi:hypothetical protein
MNIGLVFVFWGMIAVASVIALCIAKYVIRLNWPWSVGIASGAALSVVIIFYACMTATDVVVARPGIHPSN